MPDSNPFATRFTRPGAIDFVFPPGESAEILVARLRDNGWQGQIVGPHGSGKSTLLATLLPALEGAGRQVERQTIAGGQRSLPAGFAGSSWNAETLLILDGFEQLGWLARRQLRRFVRQQGAGLLVTSHRDVGLPTIFQTRPSAALAAELVARLLPPGDATLTPDDISRAHAAHGDNLREMLFALFDVYRSRQ